MSDLTIKKWSGDQVALIKETCCKGASDDELNLFLYVAKKTGLDPLTRQIYSVSRWDSRLGRETRTIQTGVDGFRVVAERSGKYAGQLGPFWCGKDGIWKDVWLSEENPLAAKVAVLRSDFKEPLFAIANWSAYAQKGKDGKPTRFWAQMPALMIAKVAEVLALRKAFPHDLSGLYSTEEMAQADNGIQEKVKESESPFTTEEKRSLLFNHVQLTDASNIEKVNWVKSASDMDLNEAIKKLQGRGEL
jgi:phage recombination protein Bet